MNRAAWVCTAYAVCRNSKPGIAHSANIDLDLPTHEEQLPDTYLQLLHTDRIEDQIAKFDLVTLYMNIRHGSDAARRQIEETLVRLGEKLHRFSLPAPEAK